MTGTRAKRIGLWLLGLLIFAAACFGAWIATLPAEPEGDALSSPIGAAETAATLAALAPTRRARTRPLIAIIGINDGTETTDYMMPYGILRRADVADVALLATKAGPVRLYPALTVLPDATIAQFDAQYPGGADYIVVPAMIREDDPAVLRWLREQAAKGATVIGVCVGGPTVAAAGLLNGKRATTHWYSRDGMLSDYPSIRYVPDRRFVADRGIMTTTGITASMPAMVTLIEAIAGPEKARAVADDLRLDSWDARHDSSRFRLTRPFVAAVLRNRLFHWGKDEIAIALHPGIDEVSLALAADAWSRTYRSQAISYSVTASPTVTANGMRVIPDVTRGSSGPGIRKLMVKAPPVETLRTALDNIGARYGRPTAELVMKQLEYSDRRRSE